MKNPQQSLAVTTWECSSEGHALHCDYKQHRERGGTIMPRSSHLACVSDVFLYASNTPTFLWGSFSEQLWGFKLWRAQASAATFWSWSQKTVAVLCHSHCSCSQYFWRLEALKRFDRGSKNSNDWDCERGIECSNPTYVIKAREALLKMNISHFRDCWMNHLNAYNDVRMKMFWINLHFKKSNDFTAANFSFFFLHPSPTSSHNFLTFICLSGE